MALDPTQASLIGGIAGAFLGSSLTGLVSYGLSLRKKRENVDEMYFSRRMEVAAQLYEDHLELQSAFNTTRTGSSAIYGWITLQPGLDPFEDRSPDLKALSSYARETFAKTHNRVVQNALYLGADFLRS